MHLEIISPDKKLYEDEVTTLTLPGIDGSFGILDKHAPLISALKKGKIKVTDKASARHVFEINGGVVEVLNNKVIVLAE
ncbi:MAG TPA: ATP synthase F1 subunit epsilon [Flavobacteriales bacterium]|jgi:F-type H+-transporting ATPase subunit epsilon|nr:ATP synthase F1 subunit epsilon [Flavobacteriales bacterium]HPH82965.1 ATP synthase F1 subunit epsilon [Flavobacteriales bacterium]